MSGDSVMTSPSPIMTNTPAHCAVTPNMGPRAAPAIDLSNILYKVITPYNAQAWLLALAEADITHSYPNLVHDLTHSSPISNPPSYIHFLALKCFFGEPAS